MVIRLNNRRAAESNPIKVIVKEDTTLVQVPLGCQRCACYRDDPERVTLVDSLCLLLTDEKITGLQYHVYSALFLAIVSVIGIQVMKLLEKHDKFMFFISFVVKSACILLIVVLVLLVLIYYYFTTAIKKYSKEMDYERLKQGSRNGVRRPRQYVRRAPLSMVR
ncbi:uncharacterized protein [Cherax quadricarinatus]